MNAPQPIRGVHVHCEFEQGSQRWLEARCGLLTASEFDRILTPTLKVADNPKTRAHLWEMAAQRITSYVEPQYISDAMLRGQEDEILAREDYAKHYAPVQQCGFVTNSKWGFTLGCSPDGLVGDDGLIECKSRGQKFQVQTIVEHFEDGTVPDDFILQVQGQLLITERKWCDLLSRCGGLHQIAMRIHADEAVQAAILEAAAKFESRINEVVALWHQALASGLRLIPTERREEEEMVI
jgi:predicted phage-related endonuclease